jgi:hypothetical protein
MTTTYSVWLKSRILVDVLVLAGLYTLRVLAGGVAADVPVSEWLLAFSGFLFISLAFVKRYAELLNLSNSGGSEARGRGYQVADLGLIESIGITSGLLAVLVFAMYINSEVVKQLYGASWPLWLICPLLLYWISRLWFLARAGSLSEDPVVFAVRDPVSWIIGVAVGLLMILATAVESGDSNSQLRDESASIGTQMMSQPAHKELKPDSSGEDFVKNFAFNVGQSEIAAVKAVGQLLVVDAHLMQDGGVDIVYVDPVFDGFVAEFVRGPVLSSALEAASGEPGSKCIRVVVPA